MSANWYKPHLLVVPEDEADRKLAFGFSYHPAVADRAIDVRVPAGGWARVLDVFEEEYIPRLRNFRHAHVVLVIDFDEKGENRRALCEQRIPPDLKPRTFLIGAKANPERLAQELTLTLEQIGFALADDCGRDDLGRWTHPHLVHNLAEVQRMRPIVHPILFGA